MSAALVPWQARARIVAAAAELGDEDALLLARLVELGTREELRLELRAHVEPETMTPTPRALVIKGLVLGALDALAGKRR